MRGVFAPLGPLLDDKLHRTFAENDQLALQAQRMKTIKLTRSPGVNWSVSPDSKLPPIPDGPLRNHAAESDGHSIGKATSVNELRHCTVDDCLAPPSTFGSRR